MSDLAGMVEYVRREQKALASISDEAMLNADFQFGAPPFSALFSITSRVCSRF